MSLVVALCYFVCAVVWGTTWYAIRVCIGEGGYPTFAAAALRFTIAAAVLLGLVAIGLGRPLPKNRRAFWYLVLAGLFNAGGYAMVYLAEERIAGGMVAVLYGTLPLLVALFAKLTRTEQVRNVDVVAAILSLAGVVILFSDRLNVSATQAGGIALGMGGVLSAVAYTLVMKREAGEVSPLSSTAVFLSVAAVVLWPGVWLRDPTPPPWPPPALPTLALLYLALVGSVLAFVCYFHLLRRVSVMTVSSLVFIQPVIALLVDAAWEAEADVALTPRSTLGVVVILAGVGGSIAWKGWRRHQQIAAEGAASR